ncbi:acyltransferase family protein [Aquimarina pacifica]|uniref:acyltransferase family protein n=1 Tax=Aquimarina pacifica TaxID=1296415 RepID=UPI0004B04AE2|nr:acyltransferase family protein [Aquimarina pacifica]
MEKKIRRYDIDWLRVIVFGLLIFYHVGMFFVPWGWHLKNNNTYQWIKWPMVFVNQWRLPILFIISGIGTYFALSHRNVWQFNLERIKRLLLPLIFGMLIIIPPQVYFERLSTSAFTGSYVSYLKTVAYVGIYPEGNFGWHHLWFLPYLLIFSIVASPIFIKIKRAPTKLIKWTQHIIEKKYGLYLFIIPLYCTEAFIEPFFDITHALIDDWFNFINCFVLFFTGFIIIASGKQFWQSLDRIKSKALVIGIIAFSIQLFIWLRLEDSVLVHFSEALIKVTNLWSWILVLLGYGAKYLNKKSTTLAYCNRAVYPFYILHQTITITLGYYVMNLDWGLAPKFAILTMGTFLGSWGIYHFLILKISLLHPFFGLKKNP